MTRPEWYDVPAIKDELLAAITSDLAVPLGGESVRPSALIPRAGRVRCGMRLSPLCCEVVGVAANPAKQVKGHECHQRVSPALNRPVFSRAVELRGVRKDLSNLLARVMAVAGNLAAKKLQALQHRWVRRGQRVRSK